MSYAGLHSGLGQTASATTSLPSGSALIVRLQTLLMQAGLLNIHTADGVISSSTSATLVAIRAWATAHGQPTTGISRTSGGGLSIPTTLLNAILNGGGGGGGATTSTTSTTSDGGKTTPSAVLPSPDMVIGGAVGLPRWVPWAAGAAVVAIFGGAFILGRR